MTVGERIKAARINIGMTQKELAEKLGIPYQSIGQWERDQRNPKVDTLQRLADVLGVSVPYLMGWNQVDKYFCGREASDDTVQKIANNIQMHHSTRAELNLAFDKLNDKGQQVAVERVKELSKIPDYQKDE